MAQESIKRRTLLGMLAALPLRGQASPAELTVLVTEELGVIRPRIYGQFTEHIGRLIYEGIWVGTDSSIPNRNGYRLDTMQALQRVRPSVFRWPGGCFADTYHWEDGVGQRRQRPMRHNLWWLRDEPNAFGTDEFLQWCELLRAEPYLSVNVGSGTLSEALNWLEYCNGTGNSVFAAMRARNGRTKPYGVRLWGIGNESWGCGGLFTPTEYAQRFREYGVYFKRMGMSSDTELVGVGQASGDWNRKFLEAVGAGLPYLDHLSVHRYFRRGHSTKFSDADYINLMLDLTDFETLIRDALSAIDEAEPRRSKILVFGNLQRQPLGLIIDEWGVWHDDAQIEDGFRQNGTLRDALFAASCLNLFHQYARRITMTNIAQVINCLQSLILTQGDRMSLTPTFHVYEMYRDHQGARSVRIELSNTAQISNERGSRPALSASASRSGDSLLITIVNQSPNEDADVRIGIRGAGAAEATATSLSGPSLRSEVTSLQPRKVDIAGPDLRARVSARSVQAIRVRIS